MMEPRSYGPLRKAVLLPDSRWLLSTNQTRAHIGSAPEGADPNGTPKLALPPQASAVCQCTDWEEDRFATESSSRGRAFYVNFKTFLIERLSEDNGVVMAGVMTPPHSWTKGHEEETH